MKIWKTKEGEKIGFKEFIKRFKSGIQSITPLQRLQNEQRATFIMLVGYVVGLISLIIYRDLFPIAWFTYALMMIFIGAAYGQGIKLFAFSTQLKLFKEMESSSMDLNKVLEGLEEVPMDEGEPLEELKENQKEIKQIIVNNGGTKVYDEKNKTNNNRE